MWPVAAPRLQQGFKKQISTNRNLGAVGTLERCLGQAAEVHLSAEAASVQAAACRGKDAPKVPTAAGAV